MFHSITPLMCAVVWCGLCLLVSLVSAQRCSPTYEIEGTVYSLRACLSLPGGASVAWSHTNGTLLAGYTAPTGPRQGQGQRWSGWGINPRQPARMAGSAAFLAWRDAAGVAVAKPFQMGRGQNEGEALTSPGTALLTTLNYSAEFVGSSVKIFAAVLYGGRSLNLVWNSGPVRDGVPEGHDNGNDYENYFSTFSLGATGPGIAPPGEYPHKRLKYNHGILNSVAWGVLLPLGVMVARYGRPFQAADPRPAWFYTHMSLQVCGYILGLAGWVVGLRLRHLVDNQDEKRVTHGAIGTTIFVLSTLQVVALVVRPHKEHKVRFLWNVYHHATGYLAILLAMVNIFLGFDLFAHVGLDQSRNKKVYSAVLAVLAGCALSLEIVTWTVHFKRRKSDKNASP